MSERRAKANRQMNRQPPPPPTPEQKESMNKIANLFKPKQAPFMPVLKSLEVSQTLYRVMDIMLGDEPVECIVIPTRDLIYREWSHMTETNFQAAKEESQNDQHVGFIEDNHSGPEMGGPSDVQGAADQPGNGADGPASELQ
jgi:hypothetical protein